MPHLQESPHVQLSPQVQLAFAHLAGAAGVPHLQLSPQPQSAPQVQDGLEQGALASDMVKVLRGEGK